MTTLSLQGKMTLLSVTTTLIVFVATALILISLFNNGVRRSVDRLLSQEVEMIEQALNFDKKGKIDPLLLLSRHEQGVHEPTIFQIRTLRGEVLLSSPELEGFELPMPFFLQKNEQRVTGDVTLNGEVYRLCSQIHAKEHHTGSEDVIVQVIQPWKQYQDQEDRLNRLMLLLLPFPILLVGIGSWLVAAITLRPIDQMIDTVQKMGIHDLGARLPITRGDELGRLAATFNLLFERLQNSFSSLRRFTADASHEMRTPLTTIRTQSEVLLSHKRKPKEYRDSVGSILEEIIRLERLTDTLLELARGDANITRPQWGLVCVSQVLTDWAERYSAVAEDKQLFLKLDIIPDITITADRCILDRIITNLLSNAINYTPAGGTITVAFKRLSETVELSISDTGPGIPTAERERVFERFVRLDPTRQQSTGSGLGLPIVKWAVEVHNGIIWIRSVIPHGCQFVVSLPLHPHIGQMG